MAQAPFTIQPILSAIALTYHNAEFIADSVLPRISVASQLFKYSKYTTADGFTIPDTRVGRKSAPNQIDWTATESTGQTLDYGLDDTIPQADIQAATAARVTSGQQPIDPVTRSTMLLTDLIALDRENRVANGTNGVFVLGTYPVVNRTTLSGTSQWSDFTNSDPLSAILTALDNCLARPNVLVLGSQTWSKLRTHPKVTAAIYPSGGNLGAGGASIVSRQAVAELLELQEVLVGAAWYNSAKAGQTATMTRLWGKHAALIYRPRALAGVNDVTFGFTAEWGGRIAGTVDQDPNIGIRGGTRVRVAESVAEVIAAPDAAYFLQDAVA